MDTWSVFGLGAVIAFIVLVIFGTRWLFRVNEQTFYLKQIYGELVRLNSQRSTNESGVK